MVRGTDPARGETAPPRALRRPAAGWVCAALVLAGGAGCRSGDVPSRAPIVVFAASSLTDVLESMRPEWQTAAGRPILLNLAGSGALARQILAAPRADLFLSADEAWMDRVEEAGLLIDGTRRIFLSNRLVVIVPASGPRAVAKPADLVGEPIRRISIAAPEFVPAGRYAREWLRAEGIWDAVEPRLVPAVDVRAALAAVESGLADAGIVYRTDARSSARVRVVLECSGDTAPRIAYPAAALRAMDDPAREAAARAALAWLTGPGARAHFERYGFVPIPESGAGSGAGAPR